MSPNRVRVQSTRLCSKCVAVLMCMRGENTAGCQWAQVHQQKGHAGCGEKTHG